MNIHFEAPGEPVLRGVVDRTVFAELLRKHRGQWALLGTHATPGAARTDAYDIRNGLGRPNTAFAGGAYETFSRTLMGEHRVYVRYVGNGGARRD